MPKKKTSTFDGVSTEAARAFAEKSMPRDVPNTLEIVRYMHCALCLAELPAGESPASFARLSVGFTKLGVQVWCARHEANVMHVDFEGACHPANTTRKP